MRIKQPILHYVVNTRRTLEYGAVAVDRERRIAAAQLRGEIAPRRPCATFENAGERQCGSAEARAHLRRELVEQRHGQRAPFDDELAAHVPGDERFRVVAPPPPA